MSRRRPEGAALLRRRETISGEEVSLRKSTPGTGAADEGPKTQGRKCERRNAVRKLIATATMALAIAAPAIGVADTAPSKEDVEKSVVSLMAHYLAYDEECVPITQNLTDAAADLFSYPPVPQSLYQKLRRTIATYGIDGDQLLPKVTEFMKSGGLGYKRDPSGFSLLKWCDKVKQSLLKRGE